MESSWRTNRGHGGFTDPGFANEGSNIGPWKQTAEL